MSQLTAVTTPLEETPSSTPILLSKSDILTDDSEPVTLIPPIANNHRSNSSPTVTLEPLNEDHSDPQTAIENLSEDETSNPTTVIVTSPSFNSDLSSEQIDSLDPSSTSLLQTSPRRIDHRRNKSEPVKSNSTEDLLSSTNNDSSISNNARDEPRRKSSTKIKRIPEEKTPPSSTTTSRKKKPWYNVSVVY